MELISILDDMTETWNHLEIYFSVIIFFSYRLDPFANVTVHYEYGDQSHNRLVAKGLMTRTIKTNMAKLFLE